MFVTSQRFDLSLRALLRALWRTTRLPSREPFRRPERVYSWLRQNGWSSYDVKVHMEGWGG